jgi:L-ascorbate metabolism protein UlaG (beta-lactamase superfamily)
MASLLGRWDHRRPARAIGRGGLAEGSSRTTGARAQPRRGANGAPFLTHVGHSCHLIELSGQRWLTDPWFFDPAFGALEHATALAVEEVGPIDAIFISHRHPDHFDPEALRRLSRDARIYLPDSRLLEPLAQLGFSDARLSRDWQSLSAGPVRVSFVPAVHDVPQHSLVLQGDGASVIFCGDTGPHAHWAEIRRRYRPRTALLPCDGTRVRWEERSIMTPDEAALAARTLGCDEIFQTHADATYTDPVARHLLSQNEPEAVARLAALLAEGSPGGPRFVALAPGETRSLARGDSG